MASNPLAAPAVRYATVKVASPLSVREDGATTNTPALRNASYTAVVNDRVAIATLGKQLFVIGKVV